MGVEWTDDARLLVENLIAAELTAASDDDRHWMQHLEALPVCFDLGTAYYLRADGCVLVAGLDSDDPKHAVVDSRPTALLNALVSGSRRYPQMSALIPRRPHHAIDCPDPAHEYLTSKGIRCPRCCGLGWIEPE